MKKLNETLVDFVSLVIAEAKMREADVSDGSTVKRGSAKHIKDLEIRIEDLTKWRDKQRKGSESRANYARIVQRLKSELVSAKRYSEKSKITK